MEGVIGMGGDLDTLKISAPKQHKVRTIKVPGIGRIMLTRDKGTAIRPGNSYFQSHLYAIHTTAKGLSTVHDIGSGLVTNVGVLAMANDWNWAAPSGAAINTLKLANWHATGIGATADAATDISIQTISAQGGQTPVAGTQTTVSAANVQKYRTVATIAYTGTEAVTEWGLFCSGTLTATTGSPAVSWTNGTPSTLTVTGTPLTASSSTVQGQQQNILHDSVNATPFWGLISSNTTSVLTMFGFYKVSDGTAVSPTTGTDAYTLRPVMWDHRKFAAINVVSGDSIQFTYNLTINSGG